ncbi:uncharacterized protein [Montipora foliosa]|uniref:uncharacterized protein n=1 Tax=Montipora foliosa TaxID=591990 RepID=UPI0035F1D30A
MSWPVPSANLLSAAILSRFEKDEKAFMGLFTSLSAEWLACDHTYKSVANVGYFRTIDGRWIKKFKGIFVITNEKGQPVHWKFTKTEQFEEVRNIFNQLAERFQTQGKTLSGIFTDTCCKWAGKLNDIFPGVPVKLDLFHAVQRFTSTIPKRAKYHAKILRAYALVFRDPKDLGEQRALETPEPEVLIDNLKKFQREWKDVTDGNGHLALNTNATREMKNIKVHILKGCLSGIPPGCGTNRNERLNKHLNDFLSSNKIGISLAYARCFRLFAELSSMKKMTTEYFTSYNWQNELGNEHHCDNNSKESKERLESFGIENEAYREKEECYKKWNINIVEDEKIQAVDNYIKSLLADCDSALQSLPCHSYVLSKREETKRKLNILHNSICPWRSANYLQNIFGKKIVQHQSLIQDSRPVKINWGEEEERESVESTRDTNPRKDRNWRTRLGLKYWK